METAFKEIKFRAPFSYRALRFFSLLFMTAGQAAEIYIFVNNLYVKAGCDSPFSGSIPFLNALSLIGQLSLPLLLVSVFSELARNRDHVVRIIVRNLILAVCVGFIYSRLLPVMIEVVLRSCSEIIPKAATVFLPKIVRTDFLDALGSLLPSSLRGLADVAKTILGLVPQSFIDKITSSGLVQTVLTKALSPEVIDYQAQALQYAPKVLVNSANVNVFMDISLCSLTYFFAVYTPKNIKPTKLIFFRMQAAVPVIYALLGFIVSGLERHGWVNLTIAQASLLTCRKPACFLVFVAVAFFIHYERAAAQEKNISEENFESYMDSNLVDMHFSIQLSIVLAFISLLEFGLSFIPEMTYWGFGHYKWMFLGIPFIMLFSFKKTPKHRWIDFYVPIYLCLHYAFIGIIGIGTIIQFFEDLTGTDVVSWLNSLNLK